MKKRIVGILLSYLFISNQSYCAFEDAPVDISDPEQSQPSGDLWSDWDSPNPENEHDISTSRSASLQTTPNSPRSQPSISNEPGTSTMPISSEPRALTAQALSTMTPNDIEHAIQTGDITLGDYLKSKNAQIDTVRLLLRMGLRPDVTAAQETLQALFSERQFAFKQRTTYQEVVNISKQYQALYDYAAKNFTEQKDWKITDINILRYGNTPLIRAMIFRDLSITALKGFLDAGADVNYRNPQGLTALDYALNNLDPAVTKGLNKQTVNTFETIATVLARYSSQDTIDMALTKAVMNKNSQAVQLLLKNSQPTAEKVQAALEDARNLKLSSAEETAFFSQIVKPLQEYQESLLESQSQTVGASKITVRADKPLSKDDISTLNSFVDNLALLKTATTRRLMNSAIETLARSLRIPLDRDAELVENLDKIQAGLLAQIRLLKVPVQLEIIDPTTQKLSYVTPEEYLNSAMRRVHYNLFSA